jgi:hypothetical protein
MSAGMRAFDSLNFLSRCFDESFFREATRTGRWPASCDEDGKSLLETTRKN